MKGCKSSKDKVSSMLMQAIIHLTNNISTPSTNEEADIYAKMLMDKNPE